MNWVIVFTSAALGAGAALIVMVRGIIAILRDPPKPGQKVQFDFLGLKYPREPFLFIVPGPDETVEETYNPAKRGPKPRGDDYWLEMAHGWFKVEGEIAQDDYCKEKGISSAGLRRAIKNLKNKGKLK